MINVTQSYLPPLDRYMAYLERIWASHQITNRGPLVNELEEKVRSYLGMPNALFVTNGTIALQMAIKALGLRGEIITTPFSYVATTNAIIWEGCTPVFVDIHPDTYCIDPQKIESAITPRTSAIMATHVYGFPCDIDAISTIANKYSLKVIYDAAHCFGVKYKGRSIFGYGDVSTTSFHATKLFHSGEGGGVFASDPEVFKKLDLLHRFGHNGDHYFEPGINGKNSEIHAALGLCVLSDIDIIIQQRKDLAEFYCDLINKKAPHIHIPIVPTHSEHNYSYFPVVFPNEAKLLKALKTLQEKEIIPRRYFYPSLNNLPYLPYRPMPISEDIAKRVLCLPLYPGLSQSVASTVVNHL